MNPRIVGLLVSILITSGVAEAESTGNFLNQHYPPQSIGRSINTLSLKIAQNHGCFKLDKHEEAADQPKEHSFKEVKTMVSFDSKTYSDSMGVGGSMAVGYGIFSADANFAMNASSAGSSTGIVSSWVYADYKEANLKTNYVSLTAKGKEHVNNLNKKLAGFVSGKDLTPMQEQALGEFISACGGALITSISIGYSARLDIKITVSSSEAKSNLGGGARASAGGFADLRAKMEAADRKKESSFEFSSTAYSQPASALAIKPSDLSNCRWNSTLPTPNPTAEKIGWNNACLAAIEAMSTTAKNIKNLGSDGGNSIKFPVITLISSIGHIFNKSTKEGFTRGMGDMKQRYQALSDTWIKIAEQRDKLTKFVQRNAIPANSQLSHHIDHKALIKFDASYLKLTAILVDVTRIGYLTKKQEEKAKNIINKDLQLNPALTKFLGRLKNSPLNENIQTSVTYQMNLKNRNFAKQGQTRIVHESQKLFPQERGKQKNNQMDLIIDGNRYKEVVLEGDVLYKKGHTTSYRNHTLEGKGNNLIYTLDYVELCAYDHQPHELNGYVISAQNEIFPFVIHSLRHETYQKKYLPTKIRTEDQTGIIEQGYFSTRTVQRDVEENGLCTVIVDQNLNSIPLNSFVKHENQALLGNNQKTRLNPSAPNSKAFIYVGDGGWGEDNKRRGEPSGTVITPGRDYPTRYDVLFYEQRKVYENGQRVYVVIGEDGSDGGYNIGDKREIPKQSYSKTE